MADLPLALDNGAVDALGVHEPMGYMTEQNYDVVKLLDTGTDEKFKDEYCCMALVTQDMIKNNPEGAAAFARAVQKGAAFASANPEEAAKMAFAICEIGLMEFDRDRVLVGTKRGLYEYNYRTDSFRLLPFIDNNCLIIQNIFGI